MTPAEPRGTLAVELSDDEIRRIGMEAVSGSLRLFRRPGVFFPLLFAAAMAAYLSTTANGAIWAAIVLAFPAVLAVLLLGITLMALRSTILGRRMVRAWPHRTITYAFDTERFDIRTPVEERSESWPSLRKVTTNRRSWHMELASGKTILLPVGLFPSELRGWLLERLRAHGVNVVAGFGNHVEPSHGR